MSSTLTWGAVKKHDLIQITIWMPWPSTPPIGVHSDNFDSGRPSPKIIPLFETYIIDSITLYYVL
jgi:hypothetical protein